MDEDIDMPWEELGNVRRDLPSHRGHDLQVWGNVARWCGLLSLIMCLPGLIAFPLGLVIHSMGERDIRRMHAGTMDPQGRSQTLKACSAAVQGVACAVAAVVIWTCVAPALLSFVF